MPKRKTQPPKMQRDVPAYLQNAPLTPELACRAVAEMGQFGTVEQEWGTELLQVLDNAREGHREIDVLGSVAVAMIAYGGMVESQVCPCPKCRGKAKSDPEFMRARAEVLACELAQSCRTPGELMLILGTALGMVMKTMNDAV